MPIYDYKCKACDKDYEYFHVNSEDKEAVCPHCGAKEAEKLPPKKTEFILKGKGWYRDGY